MSFTTREPASRLWGSSEIVGGAFSGIYSETSLAPKTLYTSQESSYANILFIADGLAGSNELGSARILMVPVF
jgi:hypothetical protein